MTTRSEADVGLDILLDGTRPAADVRWACLAIRAHLHDESIARRVGAVLDAVLGTWWPAENPPPVLDINDRLGHVYARAGGEVVDLWSVYESTAPVVSATTGQVFASVYWAAVGNTGRSVCVRGIDQDRREVTEVLELPPPPPRRARWEVTAKEVDRLESEGTWVVWGELVVCPACDLPFAAGTPPQCPDCQNTLSFPGWFRPWGVTGRHIHIVIEDDPVAFGGARAIMVGNEVFPELSAGYDEPTAERQPLPPVGSHRARRRRRQPSPGELAAEQRRMSRGTRDAMRRGRR